MVSRIQCRCYNIATIPQDARKLIVKRLIKLVAQFGRHSHWIAVDRPQDAPAPVRELFFIAEMSRKANKRWRDRVHQAHIAK